MQLGFQLVINDFDGAHSLKIGHPDNDQEKQMIYEAYRLSKTNIKTRPYIAVPLID